MNSPRILAALVAVVALNLGGARAADIYWTNTLGGNWDVLANWSPNQVPGTNDSAFITQAGTYTVTVNVIAALGSLTAGAASGTQTVSVVSTLDLNNTGVFSSRTVLSLAGGSIQGAGEITVNGLLEWTAGLIAGPGVLNVNGGMTISGSQPKELWYRTVNNGGTVTWTGAGNLVLGYGAVLNNLSGGLFDVQTDAELGWSFGSIPTFNNVGTFRKSTGATNEATGYNGFFRNTGLVEVLSGNLEFVQDTQFRQTAGATLLKGGNIQLNGSFNFRFAGGLVGGSGKVLLLSPNVNTYDAVVSGQLSPGLSAGRVEIQGNYVQTPAGSCNIEIGGTIAGTNYDQVVVSHFAQLAGTINVVSINGFVPALGDRFEIMKFAGVSESVTFQGLDITNGIYLQPVFSPTNLVLVATNAPLSAAPKLNLAYNGDSMWLWWPLGYPAFNVQATTNLNTPIPWSPVTPAELNRHTFTPAGPAKFFRMIKP